MRDAVEEVVRDDDIALRSTFAAPGTVESQRTVTGEAVTRRYRRRRSASALSSHLEPMEIPDDQPGRVEYISVDIPEPAEELAAEAHLPPLESIPAAAPASALGAWVAVALLGLALVVFFAIGMGLTR